MEAPMLHVGATGTNNNNNITIKNTPLIMDSIITAVCAFSFDSGQICEYAFILTLISAG
jgi:hypothetical protein